MNIIAKYREQIKEIQDKIVAIQNECPHPKFVLEVAPGCNTGNYDPHCDSYWTDFHCQLCEKSWRQYHDD
jgi:nitrite reductase/ring-hydroxylating ferredoxin subunit